MLLTVDVWCQAHEVFDGIVEHYGASVFHDDDPELVLYYDPADDSFGWHEDDRIGVNFAVCETWPEVVGTLIHEFWHHLQDPHRQDEADYEAEAEAVAADDLDMFLEVA